MAKFRHQNLSAKLLSGLALLIICSLAAQAASLASEEMSNEEAARLLKSYETFAALQTIKLNTGTIQARPSDVERYHPKYLACKSMGLVELGTITIDSPDKDSKENTEATRVSLTERGVKESAAWRQ